MANNSHICCATQSNSADMVELAGKAAVYQPSLADIANSWVVHGDDNELMAFCTWMIVCDEASLLSIAVDAPYRCQGMAAQLLAYSEASLAKKGIRQYNLEVRQSNLSAQRLYQRAGYAVIAKRKNYYPQTDGSREDAIVMQKIISL